MGLSGVVGDVFRLRHSFNATASLEPCVITQHWMIATTSPEDPRDALMKQWQLSLGTLWLALLAADCHDTGNSCYRVAISPSGGQPAKSRSALLYGQGLSAVGTVPGISLPSQIATVLSFRSDLPGPAHRNRNFIPVPESFQDPTDANLLDPSKVLPYAPYIAGLLAGLVSPAGMRFVLVTYSEKRGITPLPPPQFAPCVFIRQDQALRTQRRRAFQTRIHKRSQ